MLHFGNEPSKRFAGGLVGNSGVGTKDHFQSKDWECIFTRILMRRFHNCINSTACDSISNCAFSGPALDFPKPDTIRPGMKSNERENGVDCNNNGQCFLSSIHRLGFFSTTMTRPRLVCCFSSTPSAKRILFVRTGHGSMVDADTVSTVAKNVKPKRDETKVRLWRFEKRSVLDTNILRRYYVHIREAPVPAMFCGSAWV